VIDRAEPVDVQRFRKGLARAAVRQGPIDRSLRLLIRGIRTPGVGRGPDRTDVLGWPRPANGSPVSGQDPKRPPIRSPDGPEVSFVERQQVERVVAFREHHH